MENSRLGVSENDVAYDTSGFRQCQARGQSSVLGISGRLKPATCLFNLICVRQIGSTYHEICSSDRRVVVCHFVTKVPALAIQMAGVSEIP